MTTGTAQIAARIVADPERSAANPSPDRWSATEYAAHVRDVLLTLRDRFVIGIVEDVPRFSPMYRDERVRMGLYRPDTADAVALELGAATAMFVRVWEAIDPQHLGREVMYGTPEPVRRTLLWMGQQAVHEVEHHSSDVAENLDGDPG